MLQTTLTLLIVTGAAGYSAWALMPGAWRQGLARHLGRPAVPATGCGACGGCAPAPAAAAAVAAKTQVIRIHHRSAGLPAQAHSASR